VGLSRPCKRLDKANAGADDGDDNAARVEEDANPFALLGDGRAKEEAERTSMAESMTRCRILMVQETVLWQPSTVTIRLPYDESNLASLKERLAFDTETEIPSILIGS
jgi:hypothetical protein